MEQAHRVDLCIFGVARFGWVQEGPYILVGRVKVLVFSPTRIKIEIAGQDDMLIMRQARKDACQLLGSYLRRGRMAFQMGARKGWRLLNACSCNDEVTAHAALQHEQLPFQNRQSTQNENAVGIDAGSI